jgi:hypothetical protein
MTSKTTETIAVRGSSDLAQLEDLEKLLLSGERPDVVDDPEEIGREIMMQLLAAESDEELESFGSATGWRDLEGVPVEIHGFRWRPSAYEEGANVFFVVNATRLDDGSRVVLTTGSQNVLAQLINMAKRGTLVGAKRMLTRAEKPTARGFYPLWLVTPPGTDTAA